MAEERRKCNTSSQVKRRYNNKVYSRIVAELPKELVSNFKTACKKRGISQASVLKKAIEEFLGTE